MSDFEKVMERLLVDPEFKAALAADPDRALAGYELAAEERELLGAPIATGPTASHAVEDRTTKSGVLGLVGPVVTSFGIAGGQGFGAAPHGTSTFGERGAQSLGPAPNDGVSFGHAPRLDGGESLDSVDEDTETFGTGRVGQVMGDAPGKDSGLVEARDYQTRVDVDGDGTWDAHTAYERPDGGIEIHADMDGDGRVDFIGYDSNRDGLVERADYDQDFDGRMDTRMYDDTGDGWLDRREKIAEKDDKGPQTFGNAPA